MKKVKCECDKCKGEYFFEFDTICIKCLIEFIEKPKKRSKWYYLKEMTWGILFISIVMVLIGTFLGSEYEFLFMAGFIYFPISSFLINWCNKKF